MMAAVSTGFAAPEVLDGVAAIVNSNVITYSEVREFVRPVAQQLQREYSGQELAEKIRSAQKDALNNLIDRALIIHEFHTKGYSIPETVIEEQINQIVANDYGGDRAAFTKTLQAQQLTYSQFRDQIRDRTIIQAMRNRKTQAEIVVSPHKIEQYYKEHIADYKVDDQIKLHMIFIKKDGDPEPRRKLGEELVAKLDKGAKFEDLAKQHSEAKEAEKGGDWGWVRKDDLRKELNEIAFILKPGQHSKLIETKEGFYIIRVDELKAAHTKPLTEVRDQIEKLLLQEQRAKMQENWVKELRAKAFIRLF
jgi:parvulin-like peptidyl-prolyl isomerase